MFGEREWKEKDFEKKKKRFMPKVFLKKKWAA